MKNSVLESIEGVSIYPIISLLIFVTLFVGVIIYVWRLDKTLVEQVSNLPLGNDSSTQKDLKETPNRSNSSLNS